jgi:hypothetical protein
MRNALRYALRASPLFRYSPPSGDQRKSSWRDRLHFWCEAAREHSNFGDRARSFGEARKKPAKLGHFWTSEKTIR